MPGPIQQFERGRALQRRLKTLVPAGSHTYSKGEDQFPARSPQIMVRGEGAYCWDADGNRYVDWAMGNRVISLGHAHPVVNGAVKQAIDQGVNFTRPGMMELEAAEVMTELIPWAEMVKFGKNGSDVTSAAIRLARAATGRPFVAKCRQHPFFSVHDWFIGATTMRSGTAPGIGDLTLDFDYNDLASVDRLFAEHPGQIAGLILEPVKNDAPAPGFLEGLRARCTANGAVLIFDEMIAAMKFDLRGAHHRTGVVPDLATYGKAISNGYSFSVLAGIRSLMELGGLEHHAERVFLLSQTHSSETVGLAAGMATIREAQRVDLIPHVWSVGAKLVEGIRRIAGEEGVADHVRMLGFDCNPQLLCTRADGTYWPELHTSFHEELISFGVLLPWITVTHAHGEEELAATFTGVQHAARKVRRVLESGDVAGSFEGAAVKPVFRKYNRCSLGVCGRDVPGAPRAACCTDA
jgi:glutamate-1-semialdehyde 2,1-aminomutase